MSSALQLVFRSRRPATGVTVILLLIELGMSTFVGSRGQRFLCRARRLKWLIGHYAATRGDIAVGTKDREILRLARTHAPSVLGVVALHAMWRDHEVTVVTAPGQFFRKSSRTRRELDSLARAARARRRTIIMLEPCTLERRYAQGDVTPGGVPKV